MEASQFEELVVTTSNDKTDDEWKEIDSNIIAEQLVKGLYILKVPSLGKFTDIIINLALNCKDVKIFTVSDHTEVQMKVAVNVTEREEYLKLKVKLGYFAGVSVKFDFTLPTVGQHPDDDMPSFISLGVTVPHLLSAIREITKLSGVRIDQIY